MNNLFSPIEEAFAERILAPYPHNPAAAFFIKTLLLAAKKGHLCLYIDDEKIKPSLKDLFGENFEEGESELKNSLKQLPPALLQQCTIETFAKLPICQRGNYYYLQRFYVAETIVFREWQRLLQDATVNESTIALEDGLLEEQKQAIKLACERNFVILSGGPGTGKTYTAGRMVKAVIESLPKLDCEYRVALAAPTGKAAAHLESAIKRALPSIAMTGQTLHSLLGIRPNHSHVTSLPYDFIVVDESSMIDIELMACLLSAVKTGCKLVLIGDENQLPPVEAGGIFSDLKAIHPYSVTLNKCVRAELKELAEFGACINQGNCQKALELINQETITLIDPSEISFKTLLESVAERFAKQKNQSFCLLSPLRQGPYGSDSINKMISSSIKKKSKGAFHAPIMITSNDHKKNLFNGELGWLTKHHPLSEQFTAEDFALFSDRHFYALLLPRFEYAYCLSVHKSQGSEFDEVLLILPEGAESFGRKVIYTAATRAKKKMTIYGSKETLSKTLQSNFERLSGIYSILDTPKSPVI